MNRFELEGTVDQVVLKTSRTGKKFFLVVIETDNGDGIPISVWGSPPEKGSRVHVSGRLSGWGDFANPKVEQIEIIREVDGPVRRNWRKPPAGMERRTGPVEKPQTAHFDDDGSLPV